MTDGDASAHADHPRRRGRPRADQGRAPLTRDIIAETALAIAADNGFSALTMRALSERLGVTVRALYHHVEDRQDVVNLVAERMIALHDERDLDPAAWRESVRTLYDDARTTYRRMGRAVLFALDERVTTGAVPAERVLLPERVLVFLTRIGLPLEDALVWHTQFLIDVSGFALMIDHRYDRGDDDTRDSMQDPVPAAWLAAHPDVDAPLARAATALPRETSDALFERMVERAILTIEHGRVDAPADAP